MMTSQIVDYIISGILIIGSIVFASLFACGVYYDSRANHNTDNQNTDEDE